VKKGRDYTYCCLACLFFVQEYQVEKPIIWVDADACPRPVKDMLYRLSERLQVQVKLVANQPLQTPVNPLVSSVQVASGFDVADNYIVDNLKEGDVLVSADIPLAAEAIEKKAHVITPRGEKLTDNTIAQRLTMRNFLEEMRASGEHTGGPPPFSNADKQKFANTIDRLMAKLL